MIKLLSFTVLTFLNCTFFCWLAYAQSNDVDALKDYKQQELKETLIEEQVKPTMRRPTIKEEAYLTKSGKPYEVSLQFRVLESAISEDHKIIILEEVFTLLKKHEDASIEVRAYASDEGDQGSAARRASLERALAVEEFLLTKGIEEERIYLRALGNKSAQENGDYVSLLISRL